VRKQKKKSGFIFIISGPSGSGKTTLLENLFRDRELKKRLVKSVSFTTRPKRQGEREGRNYFFVTESEFRRKLKAEKILEWTKYLGYYYATPRDFVEQHLKQGKDIALCLDLKGACRIKRFYPKNSVTVFVLPPSVKSLRERIEGRCKRTGKLEIKQRLKLAKEELLASHKYDYTLVNKNLSQALRELKSIITS